MFGQRVGPTGLDEALRSRPRYGLPPGARFSPEGHGIGVGIGFWSTTTGAGGEARVRLLRDRVLLEVGEREIGSGSVVRGLVAVAEAVLGLPADRIEVRVPGHRDGPVRYRGLREPDRRRPRTGRREGGRIDPPHPRPAGGGALGGGGG